MPNGASLNVLLVEDNPGERWLFSEILRSRGHVVTACDDGETAWEAYREQFAPLVLLDLVLPGIDGLELTRRIRNSPGGDQPVILVVTVKNETDVLEAVLEAGANDYVAKPVDIALLNIRLAVAERAVQAQEERKTTRAELLATTNELSTLFENLDEVFFSVDVPEDRLIQVSPAAHEALGVEPEKLLENPDLWHEVLYPAALTNADSILVQVAPSDSFTHSYQTQTPKGEYRWVEATLKPHLAEDGSLDRIDGTVSDVTERHRAQAELAAQNEELTTLYRISELSLAAESLGEALDDILEEVSRVTHFPIVAIERYDAERDAMVLTAAKGLTLPEDGEPLVIPVHKTLSGVAVQKRQPVVERDARSKKRHAADVFHDLGVQMYMAFPMVIGGDAVGTLTLAHTEAVEPDPWVTRLATNLAHTIAGLMERVGAAEALRESEREFRTLAGQLQQANDGLEAFAYSISHDLRTPLRTMAGFAHALLETMGDDTSKEAKDFGERIIVSGAWAENLISDLLDYSRLSFEALELQPIDLKEVISAVMEQVGPALKEAGAEVHVDEDLPTVMAQKTILVQVLANLVTNAAKFVPKERSPEIVIRCEERGERRRKPREHSGRTPVRIWVEDNGSGVPEGQEDRIFGVFERLDQTSGQPGTGIGLAIVRRGMECIGGTTGVERRAVGSAFWVDINRELKTSWRPWVRRRDPAGTES